MTSPRHSGRDNYTIQTFLDIPGVYQRHGQGNCSDILELSQRQLLYSDISTLKRVNSKYF